MPTLALVAIAGIVLLAAYLTYGRYLSARIFNLNKDTTTPANQLADNADYVPTKRSIVFGHHFTSIAGTGPIVGPAIAVMWGWLPAILWVVLGSIFIGAVHDLGSLVVSLRNKGRSIGDVAGDLLGPRVRLIFLAILIVGLWIVLAVFGLVIASVLRQYPAAITPVLAQIPLALLIGVFIHRKGKSIVIPSIIALAIMFLTVWLGAAAESQGGTALRAVSPLLDATHYLNTTLSAQPIWLWTAALLIYAYIASVIPVWTLLQPRDYINALQLITALALILTGLIAAATLGGAPGDTPPPSPTGEVAHAQHESEGVTTNASKASLTAPPSPLGREGQGEGSNNNASKASLNSSPNSVSPSLSLSVSSERPPLNLVAPLINLHPPGAPPLFPVLFITIACGACSGFHCLVASGTTSKQLTDERHAKPVAYGSMLTEGFLATLVIAACAAGIGLGTTIDAGNIASRASRAVHHQRIPIDDQYFYSVTSDPQHGAVSVTLQRFAGDSRGIGVIELTGDADWNYQALKTAYEVAGAAKRELIQHELDRWNELAALSGSIIDPAEDTWLRLPEGAARVRATGLEHSDPRIIDLRGQLAFANQYPSWSSSKGLSSTVGAFVQGSANFLAALAIPLPIAIALMAVMVASFAATTMDTACRLQRYVIQELARTFLPKSKGCPNCGYDTSGIGTRDQAPGTSKDARAAHVSSPAPGGGGGTSEARDGGGQSTNASEASHTSPPSPLGGEGRGEGSTTDASEASLNNSPPDASCPVPGAFLCPECGTNTTTCKDNTPARRRLASPFNPFKYIATTHGATLIAVTTAFLLAMGPLPSYQQASAVQRIGALVGTGAQPSMMDPAQAAPRTPDNTVDWQRDSPLPDYAALADPSWFDRTTTQLSHWLTTGGKGGLTLWPLFGATNQLLAGLAFIVITAWLIARRKPIWFIIPPAIIMLIVPAAAMIWQAYIGNADNPSWLAQRNWLLVAIATLTLALEAWLITETAIRWRTKPSLKELQAD